MLHQGITQEYWAKFSTMEQLANVGADVGRAIKWNGLGIQKDSDAALARALELLDLTIADPKNAKRLKELILAREALLDYFTGDNQFGSTDESWMQYFDFFNYAAALERGR